MRKHIIGIDLGTSNTLIWVDTSDGIIFNEPSILAWKKESHQVVEIGYLAYKILGKVPQDMELKHPSKNGVIADVELHDATQRVRMIHEQDGISNLLNHLVVASQHVVGNSAMEELRGILC